MFCSCCGVPQKPRVAPLKRPSVIKREIFELFKDTSVWALFGNAEILKYFGAWMEEFVYKFVLEREEDSD